MPKGVYEHKKEKIEIDFENGKIYRLKADGTKKEVGHKRKDEYLGFRLNSKTVSCHRYIYEQFHKCKIPENMVINHINHIRNDNRICNLELVSIQHNSQYRNLEYSKKNLTGEKNIYFNKNAKKYQVRFYIDKVNKSFGYFSNLKEAKIRRDQVKKELNALGHYFT